MRHYTRPRIICMLKAAQQWLCIIVSLNIRGDLGIESAQIGVLIKDIRVWPGVGELSRAALLVQAECWRAALTLFRYINRNTRCLLRILIISIEFYVYMRCCKIARLGDIFTLWHPGLVGQGIWPLALIREWPIAIEHSRVGGRWGIGTHFYFY